MPRDERLAFKVEWLDPQASMIRHYMLFYYPEDNTVEMDDLKLRRKFLKRSEVGGVALGDLTLGGTVCVYGRQLTVTAFGDDHTAKNFSVSNQSTLALIKPDAVLKLGAIVSAVEAKGMSVSHMVMMRLTRGQCEEFYAEHAGKPFFNDLVAFMSSGECVAMELVGENSIAKWRELIGPTNTFAAREQAPDSLRAKYGSDGTRNACHGSDSPASASRELNFFFSAPSSSQFGSAAVCKNCSLAVVKPSAVREKKLGAILQGLLDEGFDVSAVQMFNLSRSNADEFLEVYRNVVPEYAKLAEELSSGSCVAVEVRAENPVYALREFCGPRDPEVARLLRPKSLRAQYGSDIVASAVHCTDLDEDGELEVEYFFRILNA